MNARKQNADGTWSNDPCIGYFADLRPMWKRIAEFPFRLVGLIRYDPLTEIPMCEMVFNEK